MPSVMLSEHFSREEFACPCCGICNVYPPLIEDLEHLRKLCKFPLNVESACRCAEKNRSVGGAPNSYHKTEKDRPCKAVDLIYEDGEQFYKLLKYGPLFFRGIGINNGSIHFDKRDTETAFHYYAKYRKK